MNDSSDTTSSSGKPDEIGSVAEETAKLLGALSSWARDHGTTVGQSVGDAALGAAQGAAGAAHNLNDHFATGSADCLYCPICRVVHYARTINPEVKAHLVVAASSLMQAASALLSTEVPDTREPAGVEHIDLEGDDDWPSEGWPTNDSPTGEWETDPE